MYNLCLNINLEKIWEYWGDFESDGNFFNSCLVWGANVLGT